MPKQQQVKGSNSSKRKHSSFRGILGNISFPCYFCLEKLNEGTFGTAPAFCAFIDLKRNGPSDSINLEFHPKSSELSSLKISVNDHSKNISCDKTVIQLVVRDPKSANSLLGHIPKQVNRCLQTCQGITLHLRPWM